MNGPGHAAAGAATVGAYALHTGWPWWQTLAGMALATATARGTLSPDVDQRGIPAQLIPGGHRGVTHFWAVHAAITAAVVLTAEPAWRWAPLTVTLAWWSHLAIDLLWGKLPIWPRRGGWIRAGLGLDTGGWTESIATPALTVAAAGLALTAIVAPAL